MSKLDAFKKEARRAEEREDFVEAIELYGRAVTEAQEDPSATFEVGLYNRIGDLYLKLDDTSQAVYHYLLAVDEYADDGLYPPAIALCRKVLRVAPDQVDAYRKLARLHEATGLMADAREEMDRYLAGIWETGQVNGAMEGLPELVARLMSDAADLEEVRRLKDEGEPEEAFELLYRQWEDDSTRWVNGDGEAGGADGASRDSTEASGDVGFPQTEPTDRSLGDSLRRGWQGLFGRDGEEAEETEVVELEATGEDGADDGTSDEAVDAGLDDVDDMVWLREVTAADRRAAAARAADEADEAGDGEAEDAGVEADEQEAPPWAEAEPTEEQEPVAESSSGEVEDAGEAAEPATVAEAPGPDEADEADVADEADEPAGPPAEVLIAAARSLSRTERARPALTGDVAAPMLLSAAGPEVPEGRTAASERPLDRAVLARIRHHRGDRRPGGHPPEGPAFETPGRDDYLPAGAEIEGGLPGAALSWLADAVEHLHRLEWGEPAWMEEARAAKAGAAAALAELARDVEPPAALPADLAMPMLLPPARPEAEVADQVVDAGVEELPVAADEVEAPRPAVAAEGAPVPSPAPDGPSFQTPGRDDYLPAGAEAAEGLPSPALAWLAASVADIHRMDWGDQEWFGADGMGLVDPSGTEDARIRPEGFDASDEAAARATREALSLIAAGRAAAPPEPETGETDVDAEEADAEAVVEEADAAVEEVQEPEEAEASDAADVDAEAAVEKPALEEPVDAEAALEEPALEEPVVEEAAVQEAGEPDAGEVDAEDPVVDAEAPVEEAEAEAPARLSEPEPRPAPKPGPGDEPDLAPPVAQPAATPNGLDFTALLKRIGWLRGEQGKGNGSAEAEGSGREAVRPGTDDAVMAPWARGPSSGAEGSGDAADGDDGSADVRPPEVAAPGSGVPDFTDLLQKVGWLRQDERT